MTPHVLRPRRVWTPQERTLRGITEAYLEQQALGTAWEFGWLAHHTPDSRRVQGDPGYPDWTYAKAGKVIVAEYKTEVGVLSDNQQRWLGAMHWVHDTQDQQDPSAQLRVYVWRPSDWDSRAIKRAFQGSE